MPALVGWRDIYLFAYVPAVALMSWLLPQRAWMNAAGRLARLAHKLRPARAGLRARRMGLLLGIDDRDALFTEHLTHAHLARFELLRCYRPGGWRPATDLVGLEHVKRALQAGAGVVLWVTPMAHSDLVSKIALHRAGLSVVHLSRFEHGAFGRSRVGITLFNWISTRIEGRYVARRAVIGRSGSAAALRQLAGHLRANGVVSLTVAGRGQRAHSVPFLNGGLRIAAGAPGLALATGAALLPVFTVRAADGRFVTTIEAPLKVAPTRDRKLAEMALAAAYADLACAYARRWPAQFPFTILDLTGPEVAFATNSVQSGAPLASS